ncbi:S8 family serine peptidase [Fictibacillus barbaricus]|uniref:S8 family serine peptidase n=1 Tax=Fictibacillus barbaricus TaxID=182136 RepID=A0ABS2ZBQ8_9BACL|nr:S8 family serine peptidase [Fictibacillus barbaricus]MBN3544175.1 S8 family serine peptidase [Fictibacillus barbaricus]GGB69510.1 bacillopeptidase F [Fictibacillus barbaricus]
MKSKKRFSSNIILILIALLLISTALPDQTVARKQLPLVSLSETQTKNKISKKLENQYKNDTYVTFILKFKQQTDLEHVASTAIKKAKSLKLTPYQSELQKKSAVVSALRNTATQNQNRVKQYLEQEKDKGNVKEIESFYIVNAMAVTATRDVMEKLSSFGEVEKVIANEIIQLVQPEPRTVKKAIIQNPSSLEWNINKIQAPKAWKMGINGSGLIIANIDTGVQWDHPALKDKYRGYNPADPKHPTHTFNWFDAVDGKSTPFDDVGHGTHTMGTMVGAEPNSSNQIGVAPGAKWITVRALGPNGSDMKTLLTAGEWILAPKDAKGNPHPEKAPDAVNNSWGSGAGLDEWFRPMVKAWKAADIFPVFAAGNDGIVGDGSIDVPANYPESFSSAATDSNDHLGYFSSRGPSPYGTMKPEISAPGVNIRSSVPGGKYESGWNGTSMSSPHITAVAVLMKQANPSLTNEEIEKILIDTAQPLTDDKYPKVPNNGYGYGLVDAYRGVLAAQSGVGEVKGQVQVTGIDEEKPSFHKPEEAESFVGAPLQIIITAQDDIRMAKAELFYREPGTLNWKTISAKQLSGNYRGGTYQVIIPYTDVKPSGIDYHWIFTDAASNSTKTSSYKVKPSPAITIGYKQDFESTPKGWYSYGENNSWRWETAENPNTKPTRAYFTGHNPEGLYKPEHATLVMPPVHVPNKPTFLHFKQFYDIDALDFAEDAIVVVSTDLQNWSPIANYKGWNADQWVDGGVDLSAYKGRKIFIGFHYTTENRRFIGWYIDEISLDSNPLPSLNINKRLNPTKSLNKLQTIRMENLLAPTSSSPPPTNAYTLPGGARVTVLETRRSAMTNTDDGSFSLKHDAGTFTLRAESYGYRSADKKIKIQKDKAITLDFKLEQLPKGTVSGQVLNKATGKPISYATVSLIEDASVNPVLTDAKGRFTIRAYKGTYTLHVYGQNYKDMDCTVTIEGNKNIEQNLRLTPFVGYPGEIRYDDGTVESATAMDVRGSGFAVKMSLPKGIQTAKLKGSLFKFESGLGKGEKIKVTIYDATGAHGYPGKIIAGPIDLTVDADGNWLMADLADFKITVKGDFYIGYTQTNDFSLAPFINLDLDSKFTGHSYSYFKGVWSKVSYRIGNVMIRSVLDYETKIPAITSPVDGSFTNKANVSVKGNTTPNVMVNIQNKGRVVAKGKAKADGTFLIPITLQEKENVLTATATSNGTTAPSTTVKITLDRTKPQLSIGSPKNHEKIKRETTTVTGKVNDANLLSVRVNGTKAKIYKDGTFSVRVMLDKGVNTLKVVAKDKAGNQTAKSIQVTAQFTVTSIPQIFKLAKYQNR